MKKISTEVQNRIELLDLIALYYWEWSSTNDEEKYWLELSSRIFWLKNELQRKGMWSSKRFRVVLE